MRNGMEPVPALSIYRIYHVCSKVSGNKNKYARSDVNFPSWCLVAFSSYGFVMKQILEPFSGETCLKSRSRWSVPGFGICQLSVYPFVWIRSGSGFNWVNDPDTVPANSAYQDPNPLVSPLSYLLCPRRVIDLVFLCLDTTGTTRLWRHSR